MKRLIILAIGIVSANLSSAQNEMDALRYSQSTFGGTARYSAMGGAFGALGADFSSLSTNPAGIAMYRKSEISFTPSLFSQTTTSSYLGKTGDDNKYSFNFGNAGIVGTFHTSKPADEAGWESFNIGFGYNRMSNFANRMSIEGNNSTSSLTDIYIRNANGQNTANLDPFSEGLAYQAYLIDSTGPNGAYSTRLPSGVKVQRKSVETSGGMGETVFTFGGNYSNKLYLGATIGVQHMSYNEQSVYSETAQKDSVGGIKSFKLNQQISTTGTGVNVKIGAIYRVTDWMRLGAAVHSPTAFTMHDDYSYDMSVSNYGSNTPQTATTPAGSFDYHYTTPARAIGSLGFVIDKRAVIGFDYEYVDYTYARFSSSPDNQFFDVNDQIRKRYTSTGNIRVGAEFRVSEPITLRAGYALYGSPYKAGFNVDGSRTSYSAGIGFREKSYFIDLAYVLTQYNDDLYLYDPTNVVLSPVHNSISASSVMVTFGVRF